MHFTPTLGGIGAIALGAIIATSAAAQTADKDWTGPYVGINVAYVTSNVCWFSQGTVAAPAAQPTPEGCQQADGGIVGGQVGYDRMIGRHAVVGIEAQVNTGSVNGFGPSATFPSDLRDKTTLSGMATARVGYALDRALFYVRGGAGFTKNRYAFRNRIDPTIFGSASETRWGPAAGVGAELALSDRVTAGFEYDHLFLGRKKVIFTFVPILNSQPLDQFDLNADFIKIKLNYRF